MAKQLQELLKKPLEFPFTYTNPDIQQCSCGNLLHKDFHECMDSKVTGQRYCDIVCLVHFTGAKWIGCTIIDEYGDSYTEQKYMNVMEAS